MKKFHLILIYVFICNTLSAQYTLPSDWNRFEEALVYKILFKNILQKDSEILSKNKVKTVEIYSKSENDVKYIRFNKSGFPEVINNDTYLTYDSSYNLTQYYYKDYYRKSLFTFNYQNSQISSIYNYDEHDFAIEIFGKKIYTGVYTFLYSPNNLLTSVLIPELSPASPSYSLPIDSNSFHTNFFEYDKQDRLVNYIRFGQHIIFNIRYSGDTIVVNKLHTMIIKYTIKDDRIISESHFDRDTTETFPYVKYEYIYKSNGLLDKLEVHQVSFPEKKDLYYNINYDYKYLK